MVSRGLVVWCAILGVAFVNGAVREFLLIPQLGVNPGQAASAVLLCLAIFVVSWGAAPWIGIPSAAEAVQVGVIWLVLTVAFEFGAGHYVFGRSWGSLLDDYAGGGAWIRVPMFVVTLLAPLAAAWSRGLIRTPA